MPDPRRMDDAIPEGWDEVQFPYSWEARGKAGLPLHLGPIEQEGGIVMGGPPVFGQDKPPSPGGAAIGGFALLGIGLALAGASHERAARQASCHTDMVTVQVVATREWDNWFGGPGAVTAVEFPDGHREELRGKLGQPGDRFPVEWEVCE